MLAKGDMYTEKRYCGFPQLRNLFFFQSDPTRDARILLRSMESNPINFVRGDLEGLAQCMKRNFAYIASEITVDADIWDDRHFLFARDSFHIENYALVFQQNFPCMETINRK